MKNAIVAIGAVLLLGGCVHMQDFNPFHEEELPAEAQTSEAEKIGPDVIAVPVEPVTSEDMLDAGAPAAADAL